MRINLNSDLNIENVLKFIKLYSVVTVILLGSTSWAQIEIKDVEEVKPLPPVKSAERPQTGKRAADKYMKKSGRAVASGPRDHYMGIHLGMAVDSDTWEWGDQSKREDVGRVTAGVTYRMGEWANSMDLHFRGDFESYTVGDDKPLKLSVMPLITFPDANSQFPLYFGAGVGLGIFFKQVDDESALSLDFQLLGGIRFFEILDTMGFFLETGLKNHFHLLSDGQYNGVYFSVGSIFTF